jgi:hypothetical protein
MIMEKILKNMKKILLFAVVALLCAMGPANATLRIMGLSHSGDVRQIEIAIAQQALDLAPGDTMILFDARTRTEIAKSEIPNDPSKARPERKLEYITPAMAKLKAYFAAAPPAGVDGSVIDASPFLDAVAPLIAQHSSEDVRIGLIGSPFFTAPGALARADYQGSFPSDGLILGDRARSPFGTLGRQDLNGATIDYCWTTGPTTFASPQQSDRVERAWGLIVSQRGGQLTTFSGDLQSCLNRFGLAKAPEAKTYTIDQTDAQVFAMYKAKDIAPQILDAAPIKTAQPPAPPVNDLQAQAARFNQPGRTTPPSTLIGPAWIGIQWREPVDLDLYVRCSPRAPFLFFGNQRSAEGTHEYDFRGGTGSTFETVDLTASCADISKATIFINFYSGRVSAPITGIVAIKFDGAIYKADFTMPALSGNAGRGLSAAGDMGGPWWVKVDVPALLRLTGAPQRRAAR